MQIKQKPSFRKVYKKLKSNQLQEVNVAIQTITENPNIGVEKVGDLAGVFVYKFSCVNQQFLLAYAFDEITLTLLLIGVHENFYKKLKQ
jgi:mRNA-degrading endonuclease RelE of RelBE toxin-antitoxin system